MISREAYCLTFQTGIINLELETIISKDCRYSYLYAKDVLKGRFKLGELLISKDCFYSLCYALYILKCRFRLGEESIMKTRNFNYYCEYCCEIMRYNHE